MNAQSSGDEDEEGGIEYRTIDIENQDTKLYVLVLPEKGGKRL